MKDTPELTEFASFRFRPPFASLPGVRWFRAKARPVRVSPAWVSALSSLILLLTCWAAYAQTEQRFEIRSAYVERSEGVYLLNATLVFELPDGAREAIRPRQKIFPARWLR